MKDINFLKNSCHELTAAEIANELERGTQSVRIRAGIIGVKCIRECDKAMYILYSGDEIRASGTIAEIAAATGLSKSTLYSYKSPSKQTRGTVALIKAESEY